jgi:hypothetical protein
MIARRSALIANLDNITLILSRDPRSYVIIPSHRTIRNIRRATEELIRSNSNIM